MSPEKLPTSEIQRLTQFSRLLERAHQQSEADLVIRLEKDPVPTEEEVMLGAFREMIEPEVRDAVFEMLHKGYAPESSGYAGKHGERQQIDGYFLIDPDTKKEIEALGTSLSVTTYDELSPHGSKKMKLVLDSNRSNQTLKGLNKHGTRLLRSYQTAESQ
ncbi:MAG: hypothetical protein Q8P90_04845 [bacterium]|nr:hypothetical protein [bacterium]